MIEIRRKLVLIFLDLKKRIMNYQTKKIMKIYNVNKEDLLNCDLELWDDLKKIKRK